MLIYFPKSTLHCILLLNRLLLENLIVSPLLKQFPTLYRSPCFITAFERVRHLFLSWARYIHSTPYKPVSVTIILMLFFNLPLGFPRKLFPFQVSSPKVYAHLLSTIRATCQRVSFWCVSHQHNISLLVLNLCFPPPPPQAQTYRYKNFIVIHFLKNKNSKCCIPKQYTSHQFTNITSQRFHFLQVTFRT